MGKGSIEAFEFQQGMNIIAYDYKNSLASDIAKADLVVSHAGAGSCLEVLEAGKPLIVVINDQLMDNHQAELANALQKRGYAFACTPDTLLDALEHFNPDELKAYEKGNPGILLNFLDNLVGFPPNVT